MENYLSNRSQFVNISDCSGSKMGINVGVPQGSLLGPKIFFDFHQ
jgi:hypothetical protein